MPTSAGGRTVLITGASGFIGRRVCAAALARGDHVSTLTRRDWLGGPWVPVRNRNLGALPFDLPADAFAGVDYIVHLAGTTGAEGEETARAVNVEGTRRLLQRAQRHGVRKIVFISSQSAHALAVTPYGKTKFEAEQVLRQGPLPVTIIRPGLVYGDGPRGLFARMARVARAAPILPLLGGGKTIVQPIHVDDLTEAILKCLQDGSYDGETLRLGDPAGVPFGDLLRMIAEPRPPHRKAAIPIPIGPVLAVVKALEARGIPLPIGSGNLLGLAQSERVDTAPDLQRLGLALRPLSEGLAGVARRCHEDPPAAAVDLDARALKVALIGAGRIGLIHALALERRRGMRLAALVDKNRGAIGFLRKIGIGAPGYQSLEQAIDAVRPDAIVVATPPASHYPLVRAGVAAGVGVLVEKPLAASREHLDRFAELPRERPIQVGYFAPSYPHYRIAADRLRAGQFGRVQAFEALALLSYFPGRRRWETSPAHSAGGVLVNSGGHVLSMVLDAFGPPSVLRAEHARRSSQFVEDSIVAVLDYGTFSGRLWASWAIEGFPQPENRLAIFTDAGALWCNNSAAMFMPRDRGDVWFSHQLDADVGFNVSPDTVGAGIASELSQLQRMVRNGTRPDMDVAMAVRLDRLLFSIYDRSIETATFSPGVTGSRPAQPAPVAGLGNRNPGVGSTDTCPIVLDLRRLGRAGRSSAISSHQGRWGGVLVHAPQTRGLLRAGVDADRITTVIPDFLAHARLLSSGRGVEFFRRLGARGSLAFASQAGRRLVTGAGPSFWTVVESMIAAELSQMPGHFAGTVLVDCFLTDLAVALDRPARLDSLLRLVRTRLIRAGVGLQTNIFPDLANVLVYLRQPCQAVHFLTSPRNSRLEATIPLLKTLPQWARCRWVAEVRSAPAGAHAVAAAAPLEWANGADALVLDAVIDPGLAPLVRDAVADAWTDAFPGSVLPECAI